MRCWYYWVFPVLGKMTAFTITGWRLSFPVAWLITAQYYPAGCMMGDGFLGADVGVLMVAIWLAMRSFTWI